MSRECPFCNISEDKDKIINRHKSCFALMSHPRKMPGHMLVIPNRHVSKFSELTQEERKDLFDQVIYYQEKILKHASGTLIKNNYLPFVKDSRVKLTHLHVHIIPRELDDPIKKGEEAVEFIYPDDKELNEWVEKLK